MSDHSCEFVPGDDHCVICYEMSDSTYIAALFTLSNGQRAVLPVGPSIPDTPADLAGAD